MVHPNRQVVIKQDAVIELALYGVPERIEPLYRETGRTLKRLGATAGGRVRVFQQAPRFEGGRPSVHDIVPWLNDLEANDPKYVDAINFLKRLHATLRSRSYAVVVAEVEG